MNQLNRFTQTAQAWVYILLVLSNALIIGTWYICENIFDIPQPTILFICCAIGVLLPLLLVYLIGYIYLQPLKVVWRAILFMTSDAGQVEIPSTHKMRYGKKLADHLLSYIYKLNQTRKTALQSEIDHHKLQDDFVATSLPLPLIVLDKNETVLFVNKTLTDYIGKPANEIIGGSIYSSFDFSFLSDFTLDKWLKESKEHSITAQSTWEHVRLTVPSDKPNIRLLDLAAYYNKDNPNNCETMLVLFDHNDLYSRDDQAVNFVALAVHELRTPLTMLRGYIEVFEEELEGKLTPEMDGFMRKMKASAQQLANFVNNILNVSRIEEDQMMLKLHSDDWKTVLTQTLQDLSLRASVRDITIKTDIQPDLPPVAIDSVSIYEVVSNLVDNAIKYSKPGEQIVVSAKMTSDGFVETTVKDSGVGIPLTAIPHLFEKFYRDYHNRQQVSGTGMGLYLCKKLVGAHGGHIWVRSKEGEGSVFGFTLLPYAQLAEELKNEDNGSIVHSAQGWIKNHSLYRR